MRLNTIKPAPGATRARTRVGRGIGSGLGKTCGRGHKGQKSRAGGFHKVGFEGGQMPLQRRLPKRGFVSPTRDDVAEVMLYALNRLPGDTVDLPTLKQAKLVPARARAAKIVLSGTIERALTVRGVALTKGARAAIEAAGGRIIEQE